MRISHLTAKNFLGLRAVDLDITTPVVLLTGPNGAGKSSLRDAVALALTADLGRVSLKKDAGLLVHDGARAAQIELTDADGDVWGVSITSAGKITDSMKGREPDPVLPYVLDAQRFAHLDAKARREFLFGLMQIGTDREQVHKLLIEAGCDEAKAKRVVPLLRSGFPAGHEEAKAQASVARGAWKQTTGEAYGSTKAETWRAERVPFDPADLQRASNAWSAIDVKLGEAQQALGALEQQVRQRQDTAQKLAGLQASIDMLERRREKLNRDEAGLAEAQTTLDKATAKAGAGERVGLVHDLARSVNALLTLGAVDRDSVVGMDADRALAAYENEHGRVGASTGDPQAREQLPNLTDARDLMATAVRNSMRDLKAAEDASAEAQMLQRALAEPFDHAAVDAASATVEQLRAQHRAAQAELDRLNAIKRAAEGADRLTADAAKHHADVLQWDAIAQQLSPDGIPARLLAQALGPINARLAQSAADAEWPRVLIGDDMDITAGGRPYRLLSESERWRCDAMLAEAIAYQSGLGLLLLDRFDVLDVAGRDDLVAWLAILADSGEIHTALVFGTLRQQPKGLPEGVAAFWIEGGQLAAANDTTTTAMEAA